MDTNKESAESASGSTEILDQPSDETVIFAVAQTQALIWRWSRRKLAEDRQDGARAVQMMTKHATVFFDMLDSLEQYEGLSSEAREMAVALSEQP